MSFIGTQELLMVLVVALVVVGPKRLPDLAKNLGKGLRNFKNATAQMREELDKSGALDDINELKSQVRGVVDDINPLREDLRRELTAPAPDTLSAQAPPVPEAATPIQEPPPSAIVPTPPEAAPGQPQADTDPLTRLLYPDNKNNA